MALFMLFICNILFCRRFFFETNSMPWICIPEQRRFWSNLQLCERHWAFSLFIYESMDVNERRKKQKHVSCHWFGFFVINVIVGSLIPIAIWSRFIVYSRQAIRSMFSFLVRIVSNVFFLLFNPLTSTSQFGFEFPCVASDIMTNSTLGLLLMLFYDNDTHIDLMEFNRLQFIRRLLNSVILDFVVTFVVFWSLFPTLFPSFFLHFGHIFLPFNSFSFFGSMKYETNRSRDKNEFLSFCQCHRYEMASTFHWIATAVACPHDDDESRILPAALRNLRLLVPFDVLHSYSYQAPSTDTAISRHFRDWHR